MSRLTLTGLMVQPPRLHNVRRPVAHFALLAEATTYWVVVVDGLAKQLIDRQWRTPEYVQVSGALGVDAQQEAARWLVFPTAIQRSLDEVERCELTVRGWVSRRPQQYDAETEFPLWLDDPQLLATYYIVSHGRIGEALRAMRLQPRDYVEVTGQPSLKLWRNYKRQVCVRHLIYPQLVQRVAQAAVCQI